MNPTKETAVTDFEEFTPEARKPLASPAEEYNAARAGLKWVDSNISKITMQPNAARPDGPMLFTATLPSGKKVEGDYVSVVQEAINDTYRDQLVRGVMDEMATMGTNGAEVAAALASGTPANGSRGTSYGCPLSVHFSRSLQIPTYRVLVEDGALRVWDTATTNEPYVIPLHPAFVDFDKRFQAGEYDQLWNGVGAAKVA